ncbi:MAG TPA: carbohydrate porin [Puia sp.]|nr:carbohydrate porin [Puia sp.]
MRKKLRYLLLILFKAPGVFAQQMDSTHVNPWNYHFQITVIDQNHSGFNAKYSGMNSLADSVETGANSVTATLYLGRRLWKGAAVHFNAELSGGHGLSSTLGVAGALNGETYRIGDPSPVISAARYFFQQMIPLGHTGYEHQEDDIDNQLEGTIPSSRLVFSAGKFSLSDFFDDNPYSHDPRTQFMNWALMSNGAWDYPANTKGYTYGLVVELIRPGWAARISSVAVPATANHSDMEYRFGKAHSETLEITKKLPLINGQPGTLGFIASYTASRAPSYQDGLTALKTGDVALLNVFSGNAEGLSYGGHKTGFYFNLAQGLTDDLGLFARAGWNDGKYATWAFTEIDQTISAGLSLKGTSWKRKDDVVGLGEIVNGISKDHQAFLRAGGYGFIIGDGNLDYGHEIITEFYYSAQMNKTFSLSVDYQLVMNPGYNKDRQGPVHVFGFRGHIAF